MNNMIKEYRAILCKTITQLNITINNMIKDGWEPSGDLIAGEFPVKHVLEEREPLKNKHTGEYYSPYEIRMVKGYLQVMILFEEE